MSTAAELISSLCCFSFSQSGEQELQETDTRPSLWCLMTLDVADETCWSGNTWHVTSAILLECGCYAIGVLDCFNGLFLDGNIVSVTLLIAIQINLQTALWEALFFLFDTCDSPYPAWVYMFIREWHLWNKTRDCIQQQTESGQKMNDNSQLPLLAIN